jgi:predicted transcriptional regulator
VIRLKNSGNRAKKRQCFSLQLIHSCYANAGHPGEGPVPRFATITAMELHLTPETEAKLNELALQTHRGADELLEEAVDHLVTWNQWLHNKVNASVAAVERGEIKPDDQVRAWLEHRERS